MATVKFTFEAPPGGVLSADEVVHALSRPGIVEYHVTTKGIMRPRIRRVEIEVASEFVESSWRTK